MGGRTILTKSDTITIVPFPGALTAQLSKVGGKGQSLIRMTQLGLPVPPGFVLTVDFFEDWLAQLKMTDEWKSFIASESHQLKEHCDALKKQAQKLNFSNEQKTESGKHLSAFDKDCLFAVRSSSPAEDLEGSSFAGGYETVLGVKLDEMLPAVRTAFASSLDYRVVTYKHQHGFDIFDPKIAVVVQKQINSSASGVAFSLNPLTNDYDEAVFNANFGLGESVVSGVCTPDTIVVDKAAMRVRSRVLGAKEERIMLNQSGGTTTVSSDGSQEFAITDGHVLSLTRYIKTLEEVFGKPVDVEWALEGDQEYILQARPVTSYVPLPPVLLTPPGKTRKLYLDVTLAVQALEKPISVLGTSMLRKLLAEYPPKLTGVKFAGDDVDHSMVYVCDGRLYMIVSHFMQLLGKQRMIGFLSIVDPLSAQAVSEVSDDLYDSHQLWISMIPLIVAPRLPRLLPKILKARAFPEKTHEHVQKELLRYRDIVQKETKAKVSVNQLASRLLDRVGSMISQTTMPAFIAARWSLERMKRAAAGAPEEAIQNLELAMPHNVTIEMGLHLYEIAKELPPNADPNSDVQDQTLPPEFMAKWNQFLALYGHRGPKELDLGAPRYRETASLLFDQVITLNKASSKTNNPLDRYEKNRQLREKAYQEICDYLAKSDEKKLDRFKFNYRCWAQLGGYRELHKFCLILVIDALRTRMLEEGKKLVKQGRLDSVERVFDLSLEDFEKRVPNRKVDLMEVAELNRRFSDKLARVLQLPPLIDSRGRIVRPQVQVSADGDVVGTPISAGVARGPIKVLHSPDEKPLNYGDVLVARATDPGWTPLFVNASAVVLEVGGLLQHGALVAREYGLPCVGGVTGATKIWEDGTMVEVDGSRGVIKVVD